jgi:hypothetical protein
MESPPPLKQGEPRTMRGGPMKSVRRGFVSMYLPAERGVAERRVSYPAALPVSTIEELTQLPLRYVDVVEGSGPSMRDFNRPPIGIDYVFGTIPGDTYGIPDPLPTEPQFIVVSEIYVPAPANTRSVPPYPPRQDTARHGQAHVRFWGWIAGDQIQLDVESNLPVSVVQRVVDVITAAHPPVVVTSYPLLRIQTVSETESN